MVTIVMVTLSQHGNDCHGKMVTVSQHGNGCHGVLLW